MEKVKTFISAEKIKIGDTIRVTSGNGDVKTVVTGVVAYRKHYGQLTEWTTLDGYVLLHRYGKDRLKATIALISTDKTVLENGVAA